MPLSPDSLQRLRGMQETYEDGLERSNPPPANGTFVVLLRKLSNRTVPTTKGDTPVIDMGFRVVGDQVYADYDFVHTIWGSNAMSCSQFSTFATAFAGRPITRVVEAYELLDSRVGNLFFNIQIGRNVSKQGQEFVEIVATGVVDDVPQQQVVDDVPQQQQDAA